MPDIDVDFCYERRDEVIRYVREKYGEDRVAGIITFGTLKGKAAIKDVGRVLEFSYGESDRIAKLYPRRCRGRTIRSRRRSRWSRAPRDARPRPDASASSSTTPCASRACCATPAARRRHRDRRPAAGRVRAALRRQGRRGAHAVRHGDVEWIGLIKFDFLGLKTLTILADAVAMVQREPAGAPSSISRRCRSTTRRPTSCSARATRSASSRWKAAACARWCAAPPEPLRGPDRRARALPPRPARQRHG